MQKVDDYLVPIPAWPHQRSLISQHPFSKFTACCNPLIEEVRIRLGLPLPGLCRGHLSSLGL